MKEIIGIVSVVLFLIGNFTACGQEGVQSDAQTELIAKQSYIDELTTQINDNEFWDSAYTATNLVQDSIEDKYPVQVSFRLETSNSERIVTAPTEVYLDMDTRTHRESIAADLIISLVDDGIINEYASGNTVRVTGVLVNWSKRKSLLDKEIQYFSACDLDADGLWEYACAKNTSFTGVPHVISPEYELTDVDVFDLAPVNKEASLSELRHIAR